jgi:uncharacterized protein (UPF0332 family)
VSVLDLLKELLRTHRYQLGTGKEFRNIGFILYFYKKILQEFVKERKKLIIKEKKEKGIKVHSPLVEEAEEFLRKIDEILKEFPPIKETVEKLEKKNFIKQITEALEE